MDSLYSMFGVALAIAAFVPIFFPKLKTIARVSAILGIIVLALLGCILLKNYLEDKDKRDQIENTKLVFETELKKKSPQTFEEMFQNLHYTDYPIASKAIDELVYDGVVQGENASAKGDDGVRYIVRVYHLAKPEER